MGGAITGTVVQAYVNQDGVVHARVRFPDNSVSYPTPIEAGGLTPDELTGLGVRAMGSVWVLTKRAVGQ
jgi:hypothetical protein